MRHRKFVHAPLELQYKSTVNKEWLSVCGFRNVAKALRWIKSEKLDESADEILLVDLLSDQEFLYSADQECFREVA